MLINLIKYKKNQIYTSDAAPDSSLIAFHTAKPTFSWTPDTGTSIWIKVNLYDLHDIEELNLAWSGNTSDITIQYSVDNVDYWDLSPNFVPSGQSVSLDYATAGTNVDASFIKVIFNNTSGFTLDTFEVKSDESLINGKFISHNIYNIFGESEIEGIPSIKPNIVEEETVTFTTTGTLPAGLSSSTTYYVIDRSLDSLQVSTTFQGDTVIITDEGTGVHTVKSDKNEIYDVSVNTKFNRLDMLVKYSIIPSVVQSMLEMYEGEEDRYGSKLFDETLYESWSLSKVNTTGDTWGLTGNNIPTDAQLYLFDFDDNDIQQTLNPLNQVTHAYSTPGTYYPRLILKYSNFQLELLDRIVIV